MKKVRDFFADMSETITVTKLDGVLIVAVMFSIVNLLLDICYAYVDPRVKAQYKKGGA